MNVEISSELIAMAGKLRTQDNLSTANPMFLVQQRERIFGMDSEYSDSNVWVNCDHEKVDEDTAKRISAIVDSSIDSFVWPLDDNDMEYRRVYYKDQWEFVTAFFTQDAAQAYIDSNKHNLTEPRIWVAGGYRNREWEIIRNLLLSLFDDKELTNEQ